MLSRNYIGPRELDTLFDDFIRPFGTMAQWRSQKWAPSCDLKETDEHYFLSLDIPGLSKDDIHIEMKENQLLVAGERKEEKSEKQGQRHVSERYHGKFSRIFTLPTTVDSDKIEANYKDGVLQIALPKQASAKPRRIEIKENAGNVFKRILGNKAEEVVR